MSPFVPAAARAGARTLPGRDYTDESIFARERERILARSWIATARVEDLAPAGAYRLCEIAGESIILTRDAGGTARAFFNVCRHRGTQMCVEPAGTFHGSIRCPYHAWTYGLDGRLTVARNMEDTPGFDPSAYPLHEARVVEWEGFIFVALAADAEPFATALSGLAGRFARWGLASMRVRREIVYDVAANWKLIFQNYSECYHCPVVHPQLERLSPWDSGRNDLTEGPVLGGYSTLRESVPAPSVIGDAERRAYYYTIFPSLMLSLHGDYAMTHHVEPVAPARTRITCRWLAPPEGGIALDDVVAFWDLTNRQDWAVSERTQAGVSSRAYEPGPYARHEGLLDAFDRHYRAVMQGTTAEPERA